MKYCDRAIFCLRALLKVIMMPGSDCKFLYEIDQFVIQTEKGRNSQFDLKLKSCWQEKMTSNCFRYTLDDVETRCVPGKYGFIAQLNIKRAIERRKPQFISDVIMPFDPEKFHFGKVHEREILFEVNPVHCDSDHNSKRLGRNVLIINVSPLEFCNSLLVPNIEKCYPQVLNYNGISLALETILMSHDPCLRIGMNSLGAYASVNHLHFHLYYLKETLYLEYAPIEHLIGDCYEIKDFPSQGFAFQLLDNGEILSVMRSVMKLVEFLQNEKIAHNIFITRGHAFTDVTAEENVFNAVRIFVWARESSFGSKNDVGFNPALCELAGHLPIKERNYFENVTEEEIACILHSVCHEMFKKVKQNIVQIYS